MGKITKRRGSSLRLYLIIGLPMTFDILLGSNNYVGSFCLIMVRD